MTTTCSAYQSLCNHYPIEIDNEDWRAIIYQKFSCTFNWNVFPHGDSESDYPHGTNDSIEAAVDSCVDAIMKEKGKIACDWHREQEVNRKLEEQGRKAQDLADLANKICGTSNERPV